MQAIQLLWGASKVLWNSHLSRSWYKTFRFWEIDVGLFIRLYIFLKFPWRALTQRTLFRPLCLIEFCCPRRRSHVLVVRCFFSFFFKWISDAICRCVNKVILSLCRSQSTPYYRIQYVIVWEQAQFTGERLWPFFMNNATALIKLSLVRDIF